MVSPLMTPSVRREISYDRHPLCAGDVFLPNEAAKGPPVLLIHGGGWKGLSKESFEFMVPFFLEAGHPVFNINYRLLGGAPWPACGDDCLKAGTFLLGGGVAGVPVPEKILVCGASAGGHLAMMTGLRLPREKVVAILSMAGPSRIDWVATTRDPLGLHDGFLAKFFGHEIGPDAAEVREASPALIAGKEPPPLFCLHSKNDQLVPLYQSEEAQSAWEAGGGVAEITVIDGDGDLHGFWIDNDREGLLRPEVGEYVQRSLERIL